ncbi:Frequency clock protein [Zalerion maritima]|uniref:Frequency clock protein n=1 Tax=Zalerion maritima TaxID=339359 RepID=A0AAD5RI20_9PEZI|nr:Frequency clock protein [Zalerion maritima]
MPDQQHSSQGTQPPPSGPLSLHPQLRSISNQIPHHQPAVGPLTSSGVNAKAAPPSLQNHPAQYAAPQNSPRRNSRRVPAPSAAVASSSKAVPNAGKTSLSRRHSSNESAETEPSDPIKWFDRSNENPAQSFGPRGMDVDPPFFQRESDSSNGEFSKDVSSNYPYPSQLFPPNLKTAVTTSSAEDYRSVIDDLTIEIKRLKEELRKHKQNVPDALKKDALFEVRVHGLNNRKKRELENTLREFAISAGGSPGGQTGRPTMNASSGTGSKHTSSTGKSRIPADSAYASMSNAGNSTGLTQHTASSSSLLLSGQARTAEQKVQSYLDSVPEGLLPRYMVMTEKEKKKLVVKRLEQIFTGKRRGRNHGGGTPAPLRPSLPNEPSQAYSTISPPNAPTSETTREAKMVHENGGNQRRGLFRDNSSVSTSACDQTESRGGNTSGSGGNASGAGNGSGNGSGMSSRRGMQSSPATHGSQHEQRATRPHDLDPDRVQLPGENMNYFRHLGMLPPNNVSETVFSTKDVASDADEWVYLNVICNMAQLHMFNVTPSFIRKAVAEKSTKFQISHDGQKIRWRGGTEGTRFSSDSSGDNKANGSTDEDACPGRSTQRKKVKTQHPMDEIVAPTGTGSSNGRNNLRFTPQVHNSSCNSFHYKPMFVHQSSSAEQTSDEGMSLGSLGQGVDTNGNPNSYWDSSGAGLASMLNRCRVNGSIMYYKDAPFCTDLSRDPPVDVSASTSQEPFPQLSPLPRPGTKRTISGSSLPTRPLFVLHEGPTAASGSGGGTRYGSSCTSLPLQDLMQLDEEEEGEEYVGNVSDSDDDEIFSWGDGPAQPQRPRIAKFEASGLGGVVPEDHFLVNVITRRTKFTDGRQRDTSAHRLASRKHKGGDTTETILLRIAELTTASPAPPSRTPSRNGNLVETKYVRDQTKKLELSPLPPPATFIPPFSSDDEDEDDMDVDFSDQDEASELVKLADANHKEEILSRLANPHLSDNTSDEDDLSSGDEEDEVDPEAEDSYDASNSSGALIPHAPASATVERAASSVATAGGGMESGPSGYDSSEDDDIDEDMDLN